MKKTIVVAVAAWLAVSAGAHAQQGETAGKKLYCWNEGGRKVCGDALPPSAVNSARIEISAKSGMRVGGVDRTLTPEEQAQATLEAKRVDAVAEADAARKRRDLAMVESYATEADLRRAYGERIILVEEGLKTSRLGVINLRQSLLSLLRRAAELELQDKPPPKLLFDNIRNQHANLLRQQAILTQQLQDRASLGSDLEDALARYRTMKAPKTDG